MSRKTILRLALAVVAIAALLATAHILANGLDLTELVRSIHGG